jgi:MFS superfamily sulfate permease-like transporter
MTGHRRCGEGARRGGTPEAEAALFTSLRGYDAGWLRGDVIAGLTVWAVLVPEALAYASIAGVSPVVGLYAAPGALLLYAAFGSSRHLVVGPMSATAVLSAAAVADVVTPGTAGFAAHTAALAITTGILALAAGLLRLGFLASFVSEPVLKGFIIGLALTIVVGQLPDLFGIDKGGGDFFEKLWDLLGRLGQTSWTTLAVGLASLALCSGCGASPQPCPGRWSRCFWGSPPRGCSTWTATASRSSGRSTAACRRWGRRRCQRPATWSWPRPRPA